MDSNKSVGKIGEEYAADYLGKHGYRILQMNFFCRLGEIDIISVKNGTYIFCEVKTRTENLHGKGYEAVNYFKIKKLKKAMYFYFKKNGIKNYKCRIDVISLELSYDKEIKDLKHFENVGVEY